MRTSFDEKRGKYLDAVEQRPNLRVEQGTRPYLVNPLVIRVAMDKFPWGFEIFRRFVIQH